MGATLEQLAVRFGCELVGDPQCLVTSVATLESAQPGSLAFLANPRYRKFLKGTRASAVVLAADELEHCATSALVCANPYAAFARIAQYLHPARPARPGIHPSAVVEPGATVADTAEIGPLCYVGAGARVGERARLGPSCVVESEASIGADTFLVGRVYVGEGVSIGSRCILHPGSVVGSDGFGLAPERDGWVKVPQLGAVRVGDDVEIGANTTVDRGALDDTVLEDDVRLDNQVQIAHNVHVGAHTALAGCAGVAGSTRLGKWCLVGGDVGIAGHLSIADRVTITARTFVNHSIHEAGSVYSGALPMDESARWRKNSARFRQLDQLARRLRALEGESSKADHEHE